MHIPENIIKKLYALKHLYEYSQWDFKIIQIYKADD